MQLEQVLQILHKKIPAHFEQRRQLTVRCSYNVIKQALSYCFGCFRTYLEEARWRYTDFFDRVFLILFGIQTVGMKLHV